MDSASQLLSARNLSIRYGDFTALDNLDLSLGPGQAIALLGPNGAGKSTCLKALSGLEAPSSGELTILGEEPKRASRAWKRKIGVLPEDPALFDALSIEEHCQLSAELYGIDANDAATRTHELLTLLGLWDHRARFASAASFGMRKKTSIALALLHNPQVLLLDEPFEGLDPVSCENVLALLLHLRAKGVAILFTSHLLNYVERLATEAVLLLNGRCVWRGSPADHDDIATRYFAAIAPAPLPSLAWIR